MGKISLLILTLLIILNFRHSYATEKSTLIIFHAGSLSVPFKKIEEDFERKYPNIEVKREASGSVKAIRKVIDLHKPCDIIASADYLLIKKMLFPNYANKIYIFATNELVLCYTEKSKYREEINSKNWYRILEKRDVKWGFSDPNLDPCGYRAIMMITLASSYYGEQIYKKLLLSNTNLKFFNHNGRLKILVPKTFKTKSRKLIIRPKAVALLGLLESGAIDYAIEYKSVALQHGLKYVELPKEINFSSFEYKNFYSKVEITLGNGEAIKGAPITYGITILKNAPHQKEAKLWINFLTSDRGSQILKENYQNPIHPPIIINSLY